MRQVNLKKYVLPNLPYLFVGLYATKLGQAWRLSSGTEFADKVLHLMDGFAAAFQSAAPSFHPSDRLGFPSFLTKQTRISLRIKAGAKSSIIFR